MTITFTRTREQIARLALRKLGVMANTDVSADMDLCYEATDLRIKEMHALGIFWRKVPPRPISFSLTASVGSASATADILFPIKMTVLDGSDDMPVAIISTREYAAIRNKSESGVPQKCVYDGGVQFVFWPVPAVATTAKLVYEQIANDTAAATAPDVDVAMMRSLKDMVAYDLATTFGKRAQEFEKDSLLAERRIRNLSAQRVDISTVPVDGYQGEDNGTTRTRSDWNTG